MIARNRDGTDCVKVVDFGIAKAADNAAQKVTKTGLVVGTPEYMSPEQLAGDKLDGRSDIYALGLVAFNILTGKLPFPADTVQESMIMRLTEPPRKLAEMRPDIAWSDDVQAALDKALARDANARYQTASEFGGALSKALARMGAGPSALGPRPSGGAFENAGPRPPLPNTRVGAVAPVAGSTRRTSRAIALSATGVVLIGGIASATMLYRGSGSRTSPVRDSVTPTGRTTSDGKKLDTLGAAGSIGQLPPANNGQGTSASGAATTSIATRLDSLERVVSGDVTADEASRVLRALNEMKSSIHGNEQLVQAAVVEAFAQSSLHENDAACKALRRVEKIAPGTKQARSVARTLSQSC
jgi:serine/threonine protein kinase